MNEVNMAAVAGKLLCPRRESKAGAMSRKLAGPRGGVATEASDGEPRVVAGSRLLSCATAK